MAGESIRVTRSVSLPRSEIDFRYSRSSGPGGQHAQKSDTRVEASFDVESSLALSETQKRRVVARAGPVLRAVAQDERSQARNRALALVRLVGQPPDAPGGARTRERARDRVGGQLRDALRVPRTRRPTKPSQAAVERRLEEKRRRSRIK